MEYLVGLPRSLQIEARELDPLRHLCSILAMKLRNSTGVIDIGNALLTHAPETLTVVSVNASAAETPRKAPRTPLRPTNQSTVTAANFWP